MMFACLDLAVTPGPGAAFWTAATIRFRKVDHPSCPQGPVGAVQPESTCAVRSPRPRLSSIARALRKLARYPRVWPLERREHVPRRGVDLAGFSRGSWALGPSVTIAVESA